MKYTDKYAIPWYEEKDNIAGAIEQRRAVTIENQLYAFATIFGNGVISGWDVEGNQNGFQVSITPGKGFIRWLAAETSSTTLLSNLPANRSSDDPIYVYVTYTDTTPQDKSVSFFFNTDGVAPAFALLLAKVVTDSTGVVSVDTSVKETIDFFANIASEVINHIHIGGDDNPSPIDLVSHVTGQLAQTMLAEIDASKISGQIAVERLAQIQHNLLDDIGDNTHNQIDTLLSLLQSTSVSVMGDVAFSNFLQLVLAVKHFWTNIDEYLHNLFAFIPGITPDDYIDLVNTTITVDKINHRLVSSIGGVREAVVLTYDTEDDFNKNVEANNVIISTNDTIYLSKPSTTLVVEDFVSVSDWAYTVVGSGTSTISSVDSHGQYGVQETFIIKFYKTLDDEDWIDYNKIEFNFRMSYTEHGPVYFQIKNGSSYNTAVQIMGENGTTDGWVTKSIDIFSMDRDQVTEIAFYTEVSGNDINKIFDFDINDIYLVSDLYYSSIGTINFIFSAEQEASWDNIHWVATTPGDSSIEVKTRSANTLSDLDYVTFSPAITVSGDSIVSSDAKYLEVQIILNASSDYLQTPILDSFTINYTTAALASSIGINTQEQWNDNADNTVNLSIPSDYIEIGNSDAIGSYQFIHSQGSALGDETIEGVDSDRNRVSGLVINGNTLPVSPSQAYDNVGASFNSPRSVQRLNSRGYLVADTGNNRVVELDSSGNLVWGLLSNSVNSNEELKPLTATYNSTTRELGISFNRKVDADSIDLSKITIMKGTALIKLAAGADTVSQEDLNFVIITISATHVNSLSNTTGDMSVTIGANAVKDLNGTYLSLSYNISVFEGNVYWARINGPVHAFKTSANNYIISHVGGSEYLAPILEMDSSANVVWSFSEVSFSTEHLGSTEKSDDVYIIADSENNRVIKVDEDTSTVIFSRSFSYYVSRATELDNGNILVTISDGVGGSGSRIVEIDSDGDVVFEWGFGLVKDPTNAIKLSNGNYVVTM